MKTLPLLVAGSLLANIGCGAALWLSPSLAPSAVQEFMARQFGRNDTTVAPADTVAAKAKPAARAGRPAKVWAQLQTSDLTALVARLRAAGFPNAVINEMIQAEVDARYAPRIRAMTSNEVGAEFWKTTAMAIGSSAGREDYNQLLRERSRALRELLIDAGMSDDARDLAQRRKFGELPRDKLARIQRIEDDYAEMIGAVRAGMNGITLPEDREKLALLAREKLADVSAILAPEELAEYSYRNSPLFTMMRSQVRGFDATDAEFRAIFQAQQALGDRIAATGNPTGSPSPFRAQYEADLRGVLGEARYAEFQRSTNSEYQALKRFTDRANLSEAAAVEAFGVRDHVAHESGQIFDDRGLSVEQKMAALQSLAQDTRARLLSILGPTAGPSYVTTADSAWLIAVERGSAVRFDAGTSTISNQDGARMYRFGGSPGLRRLPGASPGSGAGGPAILR